MAKKIYLRINCIIWLLLVCTTTYSVSIRAGRPGRGWPWAASFWAGRGRPEAGRHVKFLGRCEPWAAYNFEFSAILTAQKYSDILYKKPNKILIFNKCLYIYMLNLSIYDINITISINFYI